MDKERNHRKCLVRILQIGLVLVVGAIWTGCAGVSGKYEYCNAEKQCVECDFHTHNGEGPPEWVELRGE